MAGPTAGAGAFSLYRWSGQANDAPRIVDSRALVGLRPEALFELHGSGGTVQILSGDGGVENGGKACKDRQPAAQAFRSIVLQP